MFPKPEPKLSPNTYAFESQAMVKPTGFREYDARWLFEKEINLMGAQAVGVGRPYLWGLGAFGQEGVERVLELVRVETRAAMQQCGARSVKELNASYVRRVT